MSPAMIPIAGEPAAELHFHRIPILEGGPIGDQTDHRPATSPRRIPKHRNGTPGC